MSCCTAVHVTNHVRRLPAAERSAAAGDALLAGLTGTLRHRKLPAPNVTRSKGFHGDQRASAIEAGFQRHLVRYRPTQRVCRLRWSPAIAAGETVVPRQDSNLTLPPPESGVLIELGPAR